jgi:hypothetical protein
LGAFIAGPQGEILAQALDKEEILMPKLI